MIMEPLTPTSDLDNTVLLLLEGVDTWVNEGGAGGDITP
jgi:hypothetical protein